jgi:hypothetical protein
MKRRYVNSELVHWTGRNPPGNDAFQALSAICQEEILRLSFCPRYVQGKLKPNSAMVCFTDVPLKHSKEHCGNFGRFGIAFQKQNMISYGANPVFYTTGKHLKRIQEVAELTANLYQDYKDRDWKESGEPYQFTDPQFLALNETIEFTQEYSYKNADNEDYATYYQREWRLTFNSLEFAGSGTPHTAGKSSFYNRDGDTHHIFKFAPEDVAYIIVPLRFYWQARKLAKKFNCGVKVYELAVGT